MGKNLVMIIVGFIVMGMAFNWNGSAMLGALAIVLFFGIIIFVVVKLANPHALETNKYLEMTRRGASLQVGDRVSCVDNSGPKGPFAAFLEQDRTYKVIEIIKGREPQDDQIAILDNNGTRRVFNATRFELVRQENKEG